MLLSLAVAATAACAFLAPSAATAANRNLLEVQVQGGIYVTQGTAPVVGNADANLVVQQQWIFSGAEGPTSMKFSPISLHVVVITKNGKLRIYDSVDSLSDDFVEALDISVKVFSGDDHGLVGFDFDPAYDGVANKNAYIMYMSQPGAAFAITGGGWPNAAVGATRPASWGDANCAGVPGENADGVGSYCEKYSVLTRLEIDLEAGTAVEAADLLVDQCGGSTTHGAGGINFAKNGDMIVFYGEHSQYAILDVGLPDKDACYDATKPIGQGRLRSQRDDFIHGKGIRIKAASYRTNPGYAGAGNGLIKGPDYTIIAKGFRNPYRSHVTADDTVYVTDVGSGITDGTERIYTFKLPPPAATAAAAAAADVFNAGWPCIQGVPLAQDQEALAMQAWLTANNRLEICKPVYDALANPANPVLAKAYNPPMFKYRFDVDPASDLINIEGASVVGAIVTSASPALKDYANSFIFGDFTKEGVFYFDKLPNGAADVAGGAHTLLANVGASDFIQDPLTGFLYIVDYAYKRTLRMYNGDVDRIEPTAKPVIGTKLPITPVTAMCHDAYKYPELKWKRTAAGKNTATITIAGSSYTNKYGAYTTRSLNGMIPGPLMRMEACETYELTISNRMQGYPEQFPMGAWNTVREPYHTNIHTHGLHISGNPGADDVMLQIEPGKDGVYTYKIPCDHAGGVFWYHPHSHGSVTLQMSGGAAGMLIVDENPWLEADSPYAKMLTAHIHIQHFSPFNTASVAKTSQDQIYTTTADVSVKDVADHNLVNGCDDFTMPLTAGEWTRLRMLHNANEFSAVVRFVDHNLNNAGCELNLLALDGVTLESTPRELPDNKMFFTVSSRVDAAIKCDAAGTVLMQIARIGTQEAYTTIGTINVGTPVTPIADAPLPAWVPCRPYYLQDLRNAVVPLANTMAIEVRGNINGEKLTQAPEPLFTLGFDTVNEFAFTGVDQHPTHVHVNHMQLQGEPGNFAETPNWLQAGDWYDTIAQFTAPARVRLRTDRYMGSKMLHCHVNQHSDTGVAALLEVAADPNAQGPLDEPTFLRLGSCPASVRTVTGAVPGIVEVEDFDLGANGVAYLDGTPANLGVAPYRPNAAVDIEVCIGCRKDANGGYDINNVEPGEWLKYTIKVTKTGMYIPSLSIAGGAAAPTAPAVPAVAVADAAAPVDPAVDPAAAAAPVDPAVAADVPAADGPAADVPAADAAVPAVVADAAAPALAAAVQQGGRYLRNGTSANRAAAAAAFEVQADGKTVRRKLPPGDPVVPPAVGVPPVGDAPVVPPAGAAAGGAAAVPGDAVPAVPAVPAAPALPAVVAPAAPAGVIAYVSVLPGACFEVDPVCEQGVMIYSQGTADYNTWEAFPAEQAALMYAGVACVKLCAVTAGLNMDYLQFVAAPGDVAVGPFGGIAAKVPGTVPAASFDLGTNASPAGGPVVLTKTVSYQARAVAAGAGNRGDAPDVTTTVDDGIAQFGEGDFVSYTATVAKAGAYSVNALVAGLGAANANRVTVLVGSGACIMRAQVYNCDPVGETLARSAIDANFGSTGGAAVFKPQVGDAIMLPAGDVCFQVCSMKAPVTLQSLTVLPTYVPKKARIPGVIEAENFDALPKAAGHNKVAVKDAADPIGLSNRGGNFNYRPDAPTADIEACLTPDKPCSNGADMNWIRPQEYWRYTVRATIPRATYSATLRIGRENPAPPGADAIIISTPGTCATAAVANCAAAWEYTPLTGAQLPDAVLLLKGVFPAAAAKGYYQYAAVADPAGVVELNAGDHCLQVCALHEDFHYDSFTVNLVEVLQLPTAAPTEPAVLPPPDVPVADAPAPPKKNGATAAAAGTSTVLFTAAALLAVL